MDKKKLYRFKLVHENMWNAEQHLASVHASTDDYINSWLKIQPDKYHDRPDLLEVMSKGEYFGRLGYFSEKDGETHRFCICESCYDRIRAGFQIPVEIETAQEYL